MKHKSRARTAATLFCGLMGGIFAQAMEHRYNQSGNWVLWISTFPVWFWFGSFLTAIPIVIFVLRWEENKVAKQSNDVIDAWVKRYAD